MVCRLKAEHEQAAARTIADIVPFDLGRIENATIGGIQARLTEQTNRLHPILKFFKSVPRLRPDTQDDAASASRLR